MQLVFGSIRLRRVAFGVPPIPTTANQAPAYTGISNQIPLGSSSPLLSADGILSSNRIAVFTNTGDRLVYRESETNGYANFSLRRGSLMCWFRPSWSAAPTGARLFEVGQPGDVVRQK